ncbi:sensor histidine kinase [Rhodomicrobium vannielii]|uniref:sensor histidine kinase n=1 Tax=Rhodomicrobium vannielii TaxID=1069 RepID=UPI000B4AC937|nr:sensor histidine kinase [Rhodomicrobium vannielii]
MGKRSALRWLRWAARSARRQWARRSLSVQFAIVTSTILVLGMLSIGHWVTSRISEGVVHGNAVAAAMYTDSFVAAQVQELSAQPTLRPETREALDALLLPQVIGKPIVGFRIWKGDTIVYSDRQELVGRSFPPSPLREQSWRGKVTADYGNLGDEESAPIRAADEPILEIYAPIRETGSNRIIALAEAYEITPTLPQELASARIGSWMVVGAVTFAMLGLQIVIVGKGSRTITEQRASLRDRIADLSRALAENDTLRQRANDANMRVAEMNERYLRQIGADLHDGPVQLLGMAVLRLDSLSDIVLGAEKSIVEEAGEDIGVLRDALGDSLHEIRNISSGLAPPEIEGLTLQSTLQMAARRHERRTGNPVLRDIAELPAQVPLSLKTCLYRFAQEGLTNAFRHANSNGQAIAARCSGDQIEVHVSDTGPGLGNKCALSEGRGQGLIGLRDRVESLGGEFLIDSKPGAGTRLTVRFRLPRANSEALSHV